MSPGASLGGEILFTDKVHQPCLTRAEVEFAGGPQSGLGIPGKSGIQA